jgi:4-amino-4-deoxy-L-arabinose transferase-like glycosyltransferase
MRTFIKDHLPFILLFVLMSFVLFSGIKDITFHPYESTYLYMSGDFEQLLTNPTSLSFQPTNLQDPKQRYRLIDAPLTRYIIGIGRIFGKIPPLQYDWDWSESWDANIQKGAFPSEDLLSAGRYAMTTLLLLSTIFIYASGNAIGGRLSGILAALLLGINALALLHARRAMAEGVQIFGIAFFLYSLSKSYKYPWMTGLSLAIAINAKHSSLLLFPVGLLAVCWIQENSERNMIKMITNISLFLAVFTIVTILLNPVFWNHPLKAVTTAFSERQNLLQQQVSDTYDAMPEMVLDNPSKRVFALAANLYLLPPSIADVGNYLNQTSASEKTYFSNPFNNLFRGLIGGGIMMTLTLFGIMLSGLKIYTQPHGIKRIIILYLLVTIAIFVGLLVLIPLPWQRYVIPVIPLVCLYIGYGLASLLNFIRNRMSLTRLNNNRST